MTPTTTVQLGDFTFQRFEVPEQIPFGGEQALVTHRLVGGKKIVDAMGYFPDAIGWSGWLVGPDAEARGKALEALARDGLARDLSWAGFLYSIVVHSVKCDYQRINRIPYRIECEVVEDKTTGGSSSAAGSSIDDLVGGDMSTANVLVGGFPSLSGSMGTLNSAIAAVPSFAGATQSILDTVLTPLAVVRAEVGTLLTAEGGIIAAATTLGGIQPNSMVSQSVANLAGQIGAVMGQADLLNLDSALGRVAGNIGTINAGVSTVVVAGGNLYRIAADTFGDPMGFPAIMSANGLSDPFLAGFADLAIPASGAPLDGIFGA